MHVDGVFGGVEPGFAERMASGRAAFGQFELVKRAVRASQEPVQLVQVSAHHGDDFAIDEEAIGVDEELLLQGAGFLELAEASQIALGGAGEDAAHDLLLFHAYLFPADCAGAVFAVEFD